MRVAAAAVLLALCNPCFGGGDPPILFLGPAAVLIVLLLLGYFILVDTILLYVLVLHRVICSMGSMILRPHYTLLRLLHGCSYWCHLALGLYLWIWKVSAVASRCGSSCLIGFCYRLCCSTCRSSVDACAVSSRRPSFPIGISGSIFISCGRRCYLIGAIPASDIAP